MREIWIPELLSALLALVFLIRPLFKGLWSLDGIAWFPVLALGIVLVIFPAYGFRPECVPLALNHLVIALLNLNPLFMGARRNAEFHERGALFIIPSLGCLALASALALWFAPVLQDPVTARTVTLEAPGRAGGSYTLHIFEGGSSSPPSGTEPSRPLIFLVPPDFGRLAAVDRLCAALGERGFTVISYTRNHSASPGRLSRLWRAFRQGTRLKKANDMGRALEAERRAEIEFVLSFIKGNLASLAPGAKGDALFLAGWGAGGSALAYLCAAEQSGPGIPGPGTSGRGSTGGGPGALGLVVVEGRFWSSWPVSPPPERSAPSPGFFGSLAAKGRDWLDRFRPEKVEAPVTVPRPAIPVLYLVSDRALDGDRGEQGYAAVFAALRNPGGPAALAVMEGAGPLDYSDLPAEYPLYRALFPGRSKGRGDYAESGAALIARFYELAAAGPPKTGAPPAFTGRLRLPGGLYLETSSWTFGDLRLY
jgi:hypothetical protein